MRVQVLKRDMRRQETVCDIPGSFDCLRHFRRTYTNYEPVTIQLWNEVSWIVWICCRIPPRVIRLGVLCPDNGHTVKVTPSFWEDTKLSFFVLVDVFGVATTV